MTWQFVWTNTVAVEGSKYTNDPSDSGGETKYGITKRVAMKNSYYGDMKDLTEDEAMRIGKAAFWDSLRCDDLERLSEKVCAEVFDTAFNCGPAVAVTMLQKALNALNHDQDDYANVVEDGAIGHQVLGALALYLAKRAERDEGELVLLRVLNGLQVAYYLELTRDRVKDERYFYGWIRNRVEI